MKTLREQPLHVRVAALLVAVWAVWVVAFNAWAWTVPEVASPNRDGLYEYAAFSVVGIVIAAIGFLVAIWRPGWGEIGGGLLVTLYATLLSVFALTALANWGEIVDPRQGRTTPWVPLDSLGGVPFLVLLAAGSLLLVGGIAHVGKALRDKPWSVRVALVLVAVWAVWLFAFVVWAASTAELQTENNLYMELVFWSLMAFIAVAIGLVFARKPGWGEIVGGLLVTAVAGFFCWYSVDALRHWGEIQIGTTSGRSTSSPWVVLDSIWNLPFWVLLVAGALLLVGGIVHVVHLAHGTTPRAGAAM